MRKDSYLSPAAGTLEIAAMRQGQPTASIVLDLGIPKFPVFSIKFPIPPREPGVFNQVASEALAVMLDEMTAFMLSLHYRKEIIAQIYALALACYKELAEKDKSEAQEPTLKTVRGKFLIPIEFVNETQKHLVTAHKEVKRSPHEIKMELSPTRPVKPSKSDILKAIRKYRFKSIKSQPFPLYIVVYDSNGEAKGTLALGPNFHNELLKMQYKKADEEKAPPSLLSRLYKKAEDLPSETEVRLRHQQALNAERKVMEGGGRFKGISEGLNPGELLVWFDNSFPPYTTGFLPMDGLTVEKVKAQVEAANARMKNKAQGLTLGSKRGRYLREDEAIAWGRGEQDRYYAQHPELSRIRDKKADHFDEEGNWVGEGGAASGILPICTKTGRICLAWRSGEVAQGNCWGTIGGAVIKGMEPAESARHEMKEEVGYGGTLILRPAYVHKSGSFRYFNFIGEVPQEFGLHPMAGESANLEFRDETDRLKWVTFEEMEAMVRDDRSSFHPGLVALFMRSKSIIQNSCEKGKKNGNREANPGPQKG